MHGSSFVNAPLIYGRGRSSGACCDGTGDKAEKTTCAGAPVGDDDDLVGVGVEPALIRPMELGFGVRKFGLDGLGSEQRGKMMEQSHLRYSRWQSSQPTRGEYQSLPQAKVVKDVVKLVRTPRSCEDIWVGRVVES